MPEEVCTRQAGGAAAMVARGEGQRPGKRAKPNKEEPTTSAHDDQANPKDAEEES